MHPNFLRFMKMRPLIIRNSEVKDNSVEELFEDLVTTRYQ